MEQLLDSLNSTPTAPSFDTFIGYCAQVLRAGGTLLYPTDTIWGLGCDATQPSAVERIYRIKGRPEGKSLLVLVGSLHMLRSYVEEIPEVALDLLSSYPTPLTVIYPKARGIAPNATAADGSIGIRLVHHPFCQALLEALGRPLISTSANLSGAPYRGGFLQVEDTIKREVDLIVPRDFDTTRGMGKPSAICKVNGAALEWIRK